MNTSQKVDSKNYNIENGPNADKLIDAFKYAYDDSSNVRAQFTITEKPLGALKLPCDLAECEVRIKSLEHEDGSGHSFNIEGSFDKVLSGTIGLSFRELRFKGYYNAHIRKGHIEVYHR